MNKYDCFQVNYDHDKHYYYIEDNGIIGKSKVSREKAIESLEKKMKKKLLKTQLVEFAKIIQKGIKTSEKLKCGYYNFLGWIENRDLCDEIKSLFTEYTQYSTFYDWVNGNESFRKQLSDWRDQFKKTKKQITRKEIIDYIINN